MFQTAPAHIQNRLLGLPHRASCGTCSMPRRSISVTGGSLSAESTEAGRSPDPAVSLTAPDLPKLVMCRRLLLDPGGKEDLRGLRNPAVTGRPERMPGGWCCPRATAGRRI